MKHELIKQGAATLALMAAVAPTLSLANARDIRLEKHRVVPVVLEDDLSVRNNREGDRFHARVENTYDFPEGTRLQGRVVDVERAREGRPAYMQLEFERALLPDGTSARIQAAPIAMDGGTVRRGEDGRYRATGRVVSRERIVLGGAAAGAILASLLKRNAFQGAILGAIAGIVVAENQRNEVENNVTLRSGTRMGAMIERPTTVAYNGPWRRDEDLAERPWDPDDAIANDPREDRWEREDDVATSRNRYRIVYQGRELRYPANERPYRAGTVLMVPLRHTARQLDLEVQAQGERLRVEDEDSVLVLEQGSRHYRLNGRRGTLDRAVTERAGVTYVPVEILAAMKRDDVARSSTRIEDRA